MQQILPIFPDDLKMVNYQVRFKQMDDFVHYFVNGMPVYCHQVDDKNGYRNVLGTLVNNKFCSIKELSEALGVNKKNVERYAKDLRDKGMSHFFNRKETRGQCYKFTPDKMNEALAQRAQHPYKISIGEIPEHTRYNKLKTESKHLQNIIKIICYRAETAIANLLASWYRKSSDEIRALVKSIIFAKADLYPDYLTNTLTVRLNSLTTPSDNLAIREICQTLNDYDAVFPGTKLKLVYKTATLTPA